ncbi:MAG: hypothetical protein ACJA0Y_000633 [Maricaulis maris]|jgi:hypothetical protein
MNMMIIAICSMLALGDFGVSRPSFFPAAESENNVSYSFAPRYAKAFSLNVRYRASAKGDQTKNEGDELIMEPPWIKFPEYIPREHPDVHEGGEVAAYRTQFMIWYAGLSDAAAQGLQSRFPEPEHWAESYRVLDEIRKTYPRATTSN